MNNRGFSLIELILYVGIASILLVIITSFLNTILLGRVKAQSIAEVEQQGTQIMNVITHTIRNAQAVVTPAPNGVSPSARIDVVNGLDDPTYISWTGSRIVIKEGPDPTVPLTNGYITATSLFFRNISPGNSPGSIQIQFTLARTNPTGRNEYSYSRTFYGTASLREN